MHGVLCAMFCLPDFLCILNFKCYSPLAVHTQSCNVDTFFKWVVFLLKLKGYGSLFSRKIFCADNQAVRPLFPFHHDS